MTRFLFALLVLLAATTTAHAGPQAGVCIVPEEDEPGEDRGQPSIGPDDRETCTFPDGDTYDDFTWILPGGTTIQIVDGAEPIEQHECGKAYCD